MLRIGAIFIAVCMVLIAASLGAVLYLGVEFDARSAALADPRFPSVAADELEAITIEISVLSMLRPLDYRSETDLLPQLRPFRDGVVFQDDDRMATFLPQVWEQIPDPAEFLEHLCWKMGAAPDLWRRRHLEVLTYQAQEFHEPHP